MNRIVRLTINLAPGVAAALVSTAHEKGLNLTEAIRHAIAVWKLCCDEQASGRRIVIVEDTGCCVTEREIVLL